MEKKPSKKQESSTKIPMGHDVLTWLAQKPDHCPLGDAGQKAVVEIFSHLKDAHESMSKVAGSIVNLGKVAHPDTFGFILKLAIRSLVQLKIATNLCSPGDLRFSKDKLTPKKIYKEMCCNELLLKPFHPKFITVLMKHPNCVLTVAVHFLIRKHMFDMKVSQAELAKEFGVAEKKQHMVVSGHKYNPCKKPSKHKTEPKEPKAATAMKATEPKTQEPTDTPVDTQEETEGDRGQVTVW